MLYLKDDRLPFDIERSLLSQENNASHTKAFIISLTVE